VAERWHLGDCVRLADGRIGRVRALSGGRCKVRVRRKTSKSHEFLLVQRRALKRVECPKGWMSRDGYARYLKVTLAKMRQREADSGKSG
jgi:hypothetical protein